ncbi:MAG: PDZ domain-containing protein [Candidatus Cloacimonetes bacterium]|nr:PDZ domain-containing protein [Candidatus Cloacimonadota bacterium]
MRRLIFYLIILFSISLCYSDITNDDLKLLYYDQAVSDDSLFTILSNWQNYKQPTNTGTFIIEYNEINDTLKAPYIFHVPSNYDSNNKTPLVIYLHGGVNTPEFYETPLEYAEQNYFTKFSKQNNWFILFPMGNNATAWWNLIGINNIKTQIRELKSNYNIDDNRINISGFSDGGSGSYHFALNAPDDFAAFYPLNGMISVGSVVTQIPVYLPNFKNRPIYAVNTDKDGLYPAKEMRKFIELSLDADADIFYKEYWGIGHSFDYAENELPKLFENMKTKTRDIFKSEMYWETSTLDYGKCDWLQITAIDTLLIQQDWQIEYNMEIADERISFGFYNDREYEDYGTRITKIVQGSAAETMGLKENDVIIKMDGIEAGNIEELLELRNEKIRGDHFTLAVLRADKEIQLSGKFPEVLYYDALDYSMPSGAVKARYYGNHFKIETSRVSEITIYIHPNMVNLDIPLMITLNGEKVFEDTVMIDRKFMYNNFLENHDKNAVWVNKIVLSVN